MTHSRSSIRKNDYLHAHSLLTFSLPLISCFQLSQLTVGISLFQLNLSYFTMTSMRESSCCCQSLKLFLPRLLSVVISVKSMWPSSTPFTSSPHHIQGSFHCADQKSCSTSNQLLKEIVFERCVLNQSNHIICMISMCVYLMKESIDIIRKKHTNMMNTHKHGGNQGLFAMQSLGSLLISTLCHEKVF